jgi:hypothetical protein
MGRHRIPHWHVGRELRFHIDELDEWVRLGEEAYGFGCRVCEQRQKRGRQAS